MALTLKKKFYWYDRHVVCNPLVTGICIFNSFAVDTEGPDLLCSKIIIDRVTVTCNSKIIFGERILEHPRQ